MQWLQAGAEFHSRDVQERAARRFSIETAKAEERKS